MECSPFVFGHEWFAGQLGDLGCDLLAEVWRRIESRADSSAARGELEQPSFRRTHALDRVT
jgi:hypothetical protein